MTHPVARTLTMPEYEARIRALTKENAERAVAIMVGDETLEENGVLLLLPTEIAPRRLDEIISRELAMTPEQIAEEEVSAAVALDAVARAHAPAPATPREGDGGAALDRSIMSELEAKR